MLGQDAGHHLVDGVHDLEQRIVGQVLHSELALALVARISLAQHSVAVPVVWDDLESASVQYVLSRLSGEFFSA